MREFDPHEDPGEDTNVVVMRMKKHNRRIYMGAGGITGLVVFGATLWLLGSFETCVANKSAIMQDNERRALGKGSLYKSVEPEKAMIPRRHPRKAPTALVRVEFPEEGALFVGDRDLGAVTHKDIELNAGNHQIKGIIGNKTMIQRMSLRPGEEFILRFHPARKQIEIIRVEGEDP